MAKNDDKQVRCSFCGKREGQVKRLIAGPGVFICDECIDLCCDILHDDYLETEMEEVLAGGENEPPLLKPAEIKSSGRICNRSGEGEASAFRGSI